MKVVGNMSKLTDKDDNIILPVTSAQVTFMDDGTTSANTAIRNIENDLTGCKIGVDGKEYPTLGARLDAEAQDLVNRLNENKFNKLSGDSIQAKNSLHGFTRNTMIEGQTDVLLGAHFTTIKDFSVTSAAHIEYLSGGDILHGLDPSRDYTIDTSIEFSNITLGNNHRLYLEVVCYFTDDSVGYIAKNLDVSTTGSTTNKVRMVINTQAFYDWEPANTGKTIKQLTAIYIAGANISGKIRVDYYTLREGRLVDKELGLNIYERTNKGIHQFSLGNESPASPYIELLTTNKNILYRDSEYRLSTNLASITEIAEGVFTIKSDNSISISHYGAIRYRANIIKNHKYKISVKVISGNLSAVALYRKFESLLDTPFHYKTYSLISTKNNPEIFKANQDCNYINMLCYVNDGESVTISDISLIDLGIDGDGSGEIVPMGSSKLRIPLPSNCGGLMRLGADTDRIYTSADKVILEKRIKKIVLNGDAVNETWTVNTDSSLNNDKTVLVTLSNTSIKFPKDIDTTNKLGCISDLVLYKDDAFNNYSYECFGIGGDRNALGNIDVRFLKTRFQQGANTTETIANLRAFLAANPLTIYYPSVEPDIYDLPVGSLELPTYNGETNITCVGSSFDLHASNISTEVPQDGGAVLADLQKANYNLQVTNSDLQAQISQLQVEKNQGILMSLDMFENMLTLHQNLIIPASVKAGYKNMVELGLRNINSVPEVLRDEIKQMLGMKKE